MEEVFQSRMDTEVTLEDDTDSLRSLWELVSDYERKVLLVPEHQREFVWKPEKILAWVERIRNRSRKPVGAIVTYQIKNGRPSPVYINDGSQRLRATQAFLENSMKYGGCDREKAEQIVRSVRMPLQHRHYISAEDALEDFQLLNLGTSLTPYEFCRGILAYMSRYTSTWKPLIERLHSVVNRSSIVLTGNVADNRLIKHKHQRHDYALFVRFSSQRKEVYDFSKVASQDIDQTSIKNRTAIEWQLRNLCETKGGDAIARDMKTFEGLVDRETATIESIWKDVKQQDGLALSHTLHRWILDCAIWKYNNDHSNADWENFLFALLRATQGGTIVGSENVLDRVTLGLSQLGKLKAVCDVIGSTLYLGRGPSRSRKLRTKPGYDESHIDPFVTHGNGPTVPEPASRNRARGARPIESTSNDPHP